MKENIKEKNMLKNDFFNTKYKFIVIGCSNNENNIHFNNIQKFIQGFINNTPIYFDNLEIPTIIANTKENRNKFSKIPWTVCLAITLGRYYTNPVAEMINLLKDDKENSKESNNYNTNLIKLNLSPYQKYLDQDRLAEYLKYEIANVVNKDGVKLKDLLIPHLRGQLDYISGLGPVTSKYIISYLLSKKSMSKNELEKRLRDNLFLNCQGFLNYD